MAGYGDGEALIAALVATVSGFSTATVTRGKWGVLNKGTAAKYAILKPGATTAPRRFDGPNRVTENWSTIVQVWQRYTDDGTTLTNLEADVEAILSKIDQYPRLQDSNDYVQDANAALVSEAQEMWRAGGGPTWLRQDITIHWYGKRIRSFA